MTDTNSLPRAAILARCSSEDNVCSQILTLKQYATGKYTVAEDDIYGDNISSSSAVEERVELQRLMQHIEQGTKQYAVVLVQDSSRLGKTPEQIAYIENWFAEKNLRLQFVPVPV
jgi:DNA invertase Pin-like site-specific DNA recombinase